MAPFLDQIQADKFLEAGQLILEGEAMSHPTVEVYTQQCPDDPTSDVLLTVKRTYWDAKDRVKRETMLQGEIPAEQYAALVQATRSNQQDAG